MIVTPETGGLDSSGRKAEGLDGNTPERIRTSNLRFRRPMLYPIELRVRAIAVRDRKGNISRSGRSRQLDRARERALRMWSHLRALD